MTLSQTNVSYLTRFIFFVAVFITGPSFADVPEKEKPIPSVEVNLDVLDAKGVPDPDAYLPLSRSPLLKIEPAAGMPLPVKPRPVTPPAVAKPRPRPQYTYAKPKPPSRPEYRPAKYLPPKRPVKPAVTEPLLPMPKSIDEDMHAATEPYKPPPMFGDSPQIDITAPSLAAVPAKEVAEEKIFIEPEETDKLPVPKKRPNIMSASQDFVRKVRKDYDRIIDPQDVGFHQNSPRSQSQDFLTSQLKEPTAQEVLNSLDEAEIIEDIPDPGPDKTLLVYQRSAIVLENDMKQLLRDIVAKIAGTQSRIEIQSYASSSSDGHGASRRLSLARALEIRDFLLGQHVDSKQIDVRAMGDETGDKTENTVPDRVDIYIREAANH